MGLSREGEVERDRWVDATFPHARLVWRSQCPSILQKCVWYTFAGKDIAANLKKREDGGSQTLHAIILGVGSHPAASCRVPPLGSRQKWTRHLKRPSFSVSVFLVHMNLFELLTTYPAVFDPWNGKEQVRTTVGRVLRVQNGTRNMEFLIETCEDHFDHT